MQFERRATSYAELGTDVRTGWFESCAADQLNRREILNRTHHDPTSLSRLVGDRVKIAF